MSNTSSKVHDQLVEFGITPKSIYRNLSVEKLVEQSVNTNEGMLTSTGSLSVKTGKYTGRSPQDRYIIYDDETHETIDWGDVNRQFPTEKFNSIFEKMKKHAEGKDLYVFDGFVGADTQNRLAIRVINDHAWQNLFCRQLFVRPSNEELESHEPDFTIVCLNDFETIPEIDGTRTNVFILINLSKKIVLIGGTNYAGEMKKSMFSVQNFLLPAKDVLPMHCSANVNSQGKVSLFFGLSGTGKTTLSADPSCFLIGDDEHGWGDGSVFNFEGGCYAKTIDLSQENEPVIYNAIKSGSIIENVYLDPNGEPDYTNTSLSENGRCCYPRSHIDDAVPENSAGEPKTVIFLTCDLTGLIPPVSILSKEAAAYHFLSGYTAKVGSTEIGSTSEIESTFSTCFGAPFFPRPAGVYADLLIKRIEAFDAKVFLVNTGWTGGPHGTGKRFSIPTTRRVVNAIQNGELDNVETKFIEGLNLNVPVNVEGVAPELLTPKETWDNKEAYEDYLKDLVQKFQDNIKKFDIREEIIKAGPGF